MFRKHVWILFALPLLGAFFGFLAAAVVTYVMPKIYESRVVIEMRVTPASMSNQGHSIFIRSEMEKLKDADILDSVINDLDLTNRWAMDKSQVHDILAKSITTEQIRDTDLVAIRARHINRIDAQDIVLGVATAYQNRRAEMDGIKQRENIAELAKAIAEQEITVEQNRKDLAAIARQNSANQESEEQRLASAEKYRNDQQHFESEIRFLETLKLKLISEKIAEKIPRDSVPIHEFPTESHTPVSPNVTFNLIVGTGLGMLAGVPLALLILWLLSRPERVF